jgi:predicted nucleic acid-binding protein
VLEQSVDGAVLVSSSIALVEVPRAVARAGLDPQAAEVISLLEECLLLAVEDDLLRAASVLRPALLRSLDAVHLASALSVRDRIDALVAYDDRLLEAARSHGLPVLRPGAEL